MKSLLYFCASAAVMVLAVWAYHENNQTRQTLNEVASLQGEIGSLREKLAILNAEWAYLNRPDRLMELADLNFDRLGLLPLRPEQFGRVDEIARPSPLLPSGAVELVHNGAAE